MNSLAKPGFKYEVWAQELRAKIRSGELRPGDRLPSHNAMREQYGVSRPTVERIHELLEQEGLIVREERRGAFVKAPVRSLADAIGVYSPMGGRYEAHPHTLQLLNGIRRAADESDHRLWLFGKGNLDANRPQWEHIGGVVALASDVREAEQLLENLPPGMPCVTLISEAANAASVVCDDYQGGIEATNHLIHNGHCRIAALVSSSSVVTRRRIAGYRAALEAAGFEAPATWHRDVVRQEVIKGGHVEAAKVAMRAWLNEDWHQQHFTALVAQNDEVAIGAIEVLEEAGLHVPHDISVIGYDGTDIARHFRPHLTTMEVPLEEMGERATLCLLRSMQDTASPAWPFGPGQNETVLIRPRLRLGQSTRPLAGSSLHSSASASAAASPAAPPILSTAPK